MAWLTTPHSQPPAWTHFVVENGLSAPVSSIVVNGMSHDMARKPRTMLACFLCNACVILMQRYFQRENFYQTLPVDYDIKNDRCFDLHRSTYNRLMDVGAKPPEPTTSVWLDFWNKREIALWAHHNNWWILGNVTNGPLRTGWPQQQSTLLRTKSWSATRAGLQASLEWSYGFASHVNKAVKINSRLRIMQIYLTWHWETQACRSAGRCTSLWATRWNV